MVLGDSVKQILPPLIVRAAHQAHDVATGVKIESTGFTHQFHARFLRKLVAFAAVTWMAASYKILPGGRSTSRARDHVIKREFACREKFPTILASIAIAYQDVLTRECARLMRNAPVFKQADDR